MDLHQSPRDENFSVILNLRRWAGGFEIQRFPIDQPLANMGQEKLTLGHVGGQVMKTEIWVKVPFSSSHKNKNTNTPPHTT
jgi:hypothetical protein